MLTTRAAPLQKAKSGPQQRSQQSFRQRVSRPINLAAAGRNAFEEERSHDPRRARGGVHADDVQLHFAFDDDKSFDESLRVRMPKDVRAINFHRFVRAKLGVEEATDAAGFFLGQSNGDFLPESGWLFARVVYVDRRKVSTRSDDSPRGFPTHKLDGVLEGNGRLRAARGGKRCDQQENENGFPHGYPLLLVIKVGQDWPIGTRVPRLGGYAASCS